MPNSQATSEANAPDRKVFAESAGSTLYLEYEKYDKWGNIRLKNSCLVTSVKPGDRVAESPGNGQLPVKAIGTAGELIKMNDEIMVNVKWDGGGEWATNARFLQRLSPNVKFTCLRSAATED